MIKFKIATALFTASLLLFSLGTADAQVTKLTKPGVIHNISETAKANSDWKVAFATAPHAQIVFMNISPATNPKNEIGAEVHTFDQIIFVVQGNAKVILDKKESEAKSGDTVFIPEGVTHNMINLSKTEPLKIMSVYSSNDIPPGTIYKKASDEIAD